MFEELKRVLEQDERVAYAIVFGSAAREEAHDLSDVDVGVGFMTDVRPNALELGGLVSKLESAAGRRVDLVLLDQAPAPIAYRAFRDGLVLLERDHARLVADKTRAIIEYLDFRPVEEACVRGVLAAARRGR